MKKFLPIIIFIVILAGFGISIQAQQDNYPTIVQDYPLLKACKDNAECRPGQAIFGVPEFIKYIFLFALGIVGIIGLVAIIMAAFGYVTSAGNPQQASNAKDKIISALLGLLLLLGSWVLLNMINPDLLKLKMKAPAVTVEVPAEETPITGCRYTQANFAPTVLDAGASATLTFYRTNCTNEENKNTIIKITMAQTSPGASIDLNCGEMVNDASKNIVTNTDTKFAEKFTFNKKCNEATIGWNCKWGGLDHPGPIICNMQKDKAENFYIKKAEIKIQNKPTQYMPRIDITVNDGR